MGCSYLPGASSEVLDGSHCCLKGVCTASKVLYYGKIQVDYFRLP